MNDECILMRSLINNVINCEMLDIHLLNGWMEGRREEGRKVNGWIDTRKGKVLDKAVWRVGLLVQSGRGNGSDLTLPVKKRSFHWVDYTVLVDSPRGDSRLIKHWWPGKTSDFANESLEPDFSRFLLNWYKCFHSVDMFLGINGASFCLTCLVPSSPR